MKKANDEGTNVNFAGKKLFINGNEYADQPGGQRSVEHLGGPEERSLKVISWNVNRRKLH